MHLRLVELNQWTLMRPQADSGFYSWNRRDFHAAYGLRPGPNNLMPRTRRSTRLGITGILHASAAIESRSDRRRLGRDFSLQRDWVTVGSSRPSPCCNDSDCHGGLQPTGTGFKFQVGHWQLELVLPAGVQVWSWRYSASRLSRPPAPRHCMVMCRRSGWLPGRLKPWILWPCCPTWNQNPNQ